jgi:prepilin-type N-terminal cleavage/methylation domain-containing protein
MDNHMEEVRIEKRDKGFTLVELLIVIVILGILATVTVFAVRGITNQGQESACSADQKTLEVAAEAWFANNSTDVIPNATAAEIAEEAAKTPAVVITASPEGKLVADGLMRSESANFTLTSNGGVSPTPDAVGFDNPCFTPAP